MQRPYSNEKEIYNKKEIIKKYKKKFIMS